MGWKSISGALTALTFVGGLLLLWPQGVKGLAPADAVQADQITGTLQVIDGDSIVIGSHKIRLFGIDAPEMGQACVDPQGDSFACGAWVTRQVRSRFAGKDATCTVLEIDRYGRSVAQCEVAARDMGADLVSEGFAFAYRTYSDIYVTAEAAARQGNRGLHRFEVAEPSVFRAAARAPAQIAPQADCAIKGNISERGYIYHRPGQRDYERVRINPAKGEQWFCSDSDAEKAGWRPARR